MIYASMIKNIFGKVNFFRRSLGEYFAGFKRWFAKYEKDLFVATTIIAVALIGFGLGRLSAIRENKSPVQIEYLDYMTAAAGESAGPAGEQNFESRNNFEEIKKGGSFVASKNSDKYHYPWCPGALRVKEENKIWFSSREEAENRGYAPAANCKGL